MVTRAAARHARTAPAGPEAALVAVEVEVVVPGAVLVAVEAVEVAVEVEVAGVAGVLAGVGAVVGANARVQNGDQAQE